MTQNNQRAWCSCSSWELSIRPYSRTVFFVTLDDLWQQQKNPFFTCLLCIYESPVVDGLMNSVDMDTEHCKLT